MPQRHACTGVPGHIIAVAIAAKEQVASRGQQVLSTAPESSLPGDLAGLVIDVAQFGGNVAAAAFRGTVALRLRIEICPVEHGELL